MNDTTINETDKKTTAIENRTLRFDAEPHGNYRISNERLLNSVISFKYDNTTYSNTPISLFNSEITIKGCKPLRNNNITYTEDYRKAIQPVVVEFKGPKGDGYAVCSGDVRYEKIFSYVPYGNINDTLRIDMLKYFYRNVECSINDSIAKFNAKIDSLKYRGLSYTVCPDQGTILQDGMFCMGEERDVSLSFEKYLNMKMKWHQEAPYNNEMPTPKENNSILCIDPYNNRALAGCGTIALAQAVAYKRYDIFPYINPSTWENINKTASVYGTQYEKVVAKFIREIADEVIVFYDSGGSVSSYPSTINYLAKLSSVYKIPYEARYMPRYNTDSEKENIINFFYLATLNNDPIIVMASDTRLDVGHTFVVTGIQLYSSVLYEIIGMEYEGGINKIHKEINHETSLFKIECNWGFGGSSDGLYEYNNFNPSTYHFNEITGFAQLK